MFKNKLIIFLVLLSLSFSIICAEESVGVIVKYKASEVNNLVNLSVVEVNLSQIAKLENQKDVEFVQINSRVSAFLTESRPLMNATMTSKLQSNSINLTGTGKTVCILDTGVDTDHLEISGKILAQYCYCGNETNYALPTGCCSNGLKEGLSAEDDNGHGTHVAGIVVANKSLIGVAPGANIVSIKVLDLEGTGWGADIVKGINWCVNNFSQYNISVISLSLGGGYYNESCDTDQAAYSSAINAAVSQNISVVIASGNNGNLTHISSPACIANATAIGDVYDDNVGLVAWLGGCTDATTFADKIVCHANRNSLVRLFAPGAIINSTWYTGGYHETGGTSMATPHVAGAIAIINQYLVLTGRTKTPSEIEQVLYDTGKQIYDSGTGLNFSRIDVYSAIISLDEDAPSVSLVSPANNSLFNSSRTFTCNATDLSLRNVTFYLWNSTSLYNQTSSDVSGATNTFSINISNMTLGSYNWNCEYYDEAGNSAFAASNYTLPPFLVSLNNPINNNHTNINETFFNCSFASNEYYSLSNSTFYLWNSTSGLVYNETKNIAGASNESVFNYTFTSEQEYNWNCLGVINDSNSYFASSNYSITYDITLPNMTIDNPATSLSSGSVSLGVTLGEQGVCEYSFDAGVTNTSMASSDNLSFTASATKDSGTYTVYYYCNDYAGNFNSSSREFTITITVAVVSSSSGGGGGGSTSTAVVLTNSEFASGSSKEVSSSGEIKFTSSGASHSLKVNKLGTNYANITLQSEPINLVLYVGQETKQDLNNDAILDVYLRLNSILNNKANITIKEINESINKTVSDLNNNKTQTQEPLVDRIFNPINPWQKLYIPGIVLIIVILAVLYYFENRKMHKKLRFSAVQLKKRLINQHKKTKI